VYLLPPLFKQAGLPFTSCCCALCLQIAQAKFSRWGPRPSELSDVLWALAHARHWTPLLTQLESSILAAGGPPACTAAEAVTSIWAFAVLGHTPQQLLQQLDTHGWTVKAAADKSQAPQLQNRPPAASTGSSSCSTSSGDMTSSSSDMLAALRDSQLCTLAWSLACLSQVDGSLFRAVWGEVCSRGPALAADTRQAVQLAQAALAIQLEGSYQPQELLPGQGAGPHRVAWGMGMADWSYKSQLDPAIEGVGSRVSFQQMHRGFNVTVPMPPCSACHCICSESEAVVCLGSPSLPRTSTLCTCQLCVIQIHRPPSDVCVLLPHRHL
jgi:hypothetical protein